MTSNIQHKLFNYQVQPTPSVWQNIESLLDDNVVTLAEKLYHFQEQPLPKIWEHIENKISIENMHQAAVIPFHKRYATHLRYGGSLAFFVIVATVAALFLN